MEKVPEKSPVLAALPWIFLVVAVFAFFASTGLLVYLMYLLKRSRRSEVSSNFCLFPESQKLVSITHMYIQRFWHKC
jgi:hypothetical protein